MKIGIITQPLLNNYGGIIQNYALQKILKNWGHDAVTLDCRYKSTPWWMYLGSWIKTLFYIFFLRRKRSFAKITPVEQRLDIFEDFVSEYISKTKPLMDLSCELDLINKFEAFIVGSDQVWRPKYAPKIENAFLDFVKKNDVLRISYAASFGVDNWEFTPKQTKVCSSLIKKFNAISVREKSGEKLCKDNFGVEATWVLDPTLLLQKDDYLKLCSNIPFSSKQYLAAYLLNTNDSINKVCEKIAADRGLELSFFFADSQAKLTIPEWLAMFRDASFVVTDSFHGTVFSIIFGKEFKCIYNESRGVARFESLLKLYNSGKLDEMREFSLNWLKNALES